LRNQLGIFLRQVIFRLMQLPIIDLHIQPARRTASTTGNRPQTSSRCCRDGPFDRIRRIKLIDCVGNVRHQGGAGGSPQGAPQSTAQGSRSGMRRHPVSAALSPVPGILAIAAGLGFFHLRVGIISNRLGRLLPKRLRDLHLHLHLLPKLFAVPVLEQAVAVVLSAARALVQAGDGLLRALSGLLLLRLVVERDPGVADAGVSTAVLAARAAADAGAAGADTDAFSLVLAVVGDAAGGQRVACQTVLIVCNCLVGAGDLAALEVGVALDLDLETAVASRYARLLRHARKIGFYFALADTGAAREACARRHAGVQALVLAGIAAAVLQAGDVELVADVGDDLLA